MDKKLVASTIDHAVLKPEATDMDLDRECQLAVKYGVATVCVKPSHVELASKLLSNSDVGVSTVIGFPHGSTTTSCKVQESEEAIMNGAKELDMVINIGKLLSENFDYVKKDIRRIVEVAHKKNVLVKVIIETSLLSDDMKVMACKLSEEAGADFVKTSTGFNGGGATLHDIKLMKGAVSPKIRIKASGGVKNLEQALGFIEAGCSRLGTSGTASIVGEEEGAEGSY